MCIRKLSGAPETPGLWEIKGSISAKDPGHMSLDVTRCHGDPRKMETWKFS